MMEHEEKKYRAIVCFAIYRFFPVVLVGSICIWSIYEREQIQSGGRQSRLCGIG